MLLYVSILPLIILSAVILTLLVKLYLKCTIKRCSSKVCMIGKVIIVTGANSGIGYHTARDLASRGGRVILACRDETRATEARDEIIRETGNKDVQFKLLNLSSLQSVRKFAEDVLKNEERLDVLVNNAGVHGLGDRYTADGIVEGVQINHFGPFLLTLLLVPLLRSSRGRIVNMSSIFHYIGHFETDCINKAGHYNATATYANGKLCNMLFTVELARRLKDTGVAVNAVHPGVTATNITSSAHFITRVFFSAWCWVCSRTAEEAAQTVIHLAVAAECAQVSGKFFIDCKERFMTRQASNILLIRRFWEFSVNLVGYSGEMSG